MAISWRTKDVKSTLKLLYNRFRKRVIASSNEPISSPYRFFQREFENLFFISSFFQDSGSIVLLTSSIYIVITFGCHLVCEAIYENSD